jgi:hypothetical protein
MVREFIDSFAKKQGLVGNLIEVKEPSLLSKTQTKFQFAPKSAS